MSGAFPRRWRRAWPWACSCAVLALAGCGGGEQKAQERPLPRGLAQAWADQARAIADRLDGGDACGARDLAHRLRARTVRSISRVPPRYREDLEGAVNDLASRVDDACDRAKTTTAPPPPPSPPPAPGTTTTTTEPQETEPTSTETHETTAPTIETTETTGQTEETTTAEETTTDDEQDGG